MIDDHDESEDPTESDAGPVPDGVEHLRRAAREMIGATRALLDVVEEVVERPGAMDDLIGMFGAIGDQLRRGAGMSSGRTERDPFLRDDPDPDDGFQRIRVD